MVLQGGWHQNSKKASNPGSNTKNSPGHYIAWEMDPRQNTGNGDEAANQQHHDPRRGAAEKQCHSNDKNRSHMPAGERLPFFISGNQGRDFQFLVRTRKIKSSPKNRNQKKGNSRHKNNPKKTDVPSDGQHNQKNGIA